MAMTTMISTSPYDALNARQRLGLLLIDEVPDRVVVYPLITSHAAAVAGISVKRNCTDGKAMAQAQLAALKLYGHDAVSIFSDVALVAEALGSKLYFREDDVPILQQPALEDMAAWDSLRIPDPDSLAGRYGVYLQAIEICQRETGDVTPILAFIPAPFTTAALTRGPEDFLADTLMEPQACHGLLQMALQAGLNLADLCIEAGAIPMLVDPLASASVISPKSFGEFALPYLKRFSDHLHRSDFDVFLHICGRSEAILESVAQTGCDLFSCDHVPLSAARRKIGDAVRLIGNLRPADLLEDDAATIEQKVSAILKEGKDNAKGFILSTGCEVPIQTRRENIEAFIRAGRRGGAYWGNGS
jgi:uroporphyrinogen decarboxylase